MYNITFKRSTVKELKKIPQNEQIKILKAINSLSENPHPNGHKKLIGGDIAFRIRIGNYRVIYNVYENELVIEVIRIGHRKNVYP